MVSDRATYRTFARSLEAVNERETRTYLVYEVSGQSFCWIKAQASGVKSRIGVSR